MNNDNDTYGHLVVISAPIFSKRHFIQRFSIVNGVTTGGEKVLDITCF